MHFKLGSIIRQTHEAKQASAESSSHADKASACDSWWLSSASNMTSRLLEEVPAETNWQLIDMIDCIS
jgi:hypothetical protein